MAVPLIVQDRVVGVLDVESERIGYFTEDHQRTLDAAGAADCQLGRKCAPVRRTGPARAAHGSGFEGRAQAAAMCCCRATPEMRWSEDRHPFASGARNLGRRLRLLRTRRRLRRDRVRRRQRKGRGGGSLRSADQRTAANSCAAPTQPRAADAVLNEALLERKVDAQYATLTGAAVGTARADADDGQRRRANRHLMYRARRDHHSPARKACPSACWTIVNTTKSRSSGGAGRCGAVLLRRRRGSAERRRTRIFARRACARLLKKHGKRIAARPCADAIFDEYRRHSDGDRRAITDDQYCVVVIRGPTKVRMNPICPIANARCYCDGVALADIAAQSRHAVLRLFGARPSSKTFTPTIARSAMQPHTVCYAVKANGNLAVLRLLAASGAGFDIVSGGELFRVLEGRRRSGEDRFFRRRQDRSRRSTRRWPPASSSSTASRSRSWR